MVDNKINKFFKNLRNKYRLVILSEGTFEERISIKLTPLLVLSISCLLVVVLFISTYLLFAFTPLKEYVPGKTTDQTKKEILEVSVKVEKLENGLEGNNLYIENLKNILNGEDPLEMPINENFNTEQTEINFETSEKDSLFRLKIEEKERGGFTNKGKGNVLYFYLPLKGEITEVFSNKKKHFGIDIVSKENELIKSVADGKVVISSWTNETGYIIAIQHLNGYLSLYKHNSKLLKSVGDFVKGGESVAIIGNSGELTSGPHLHFELWKNGESVNPENFINF